MERTNDPGLVWPVGELLPEENGLHVRGDSAKHRPLRPDHREQLDNHTVYYYSYNLTVHVDK